MFFFVRISEYTAIISLYKRGNQNAARAYVVCKKQYWSVLHMHTRLIVKEF